MFGLREQQINRHPSAVLDDERARACRTARNKRLPVLLVPTRLSRFLQKVASGLPVFFYGFSHRQVNSVNAEEIGMNRTRRTIEACSAELADALLIECSRPLGRPDPLDNVVHMVRGDVGAGSFSVLADWEAAAHAHEMAVGGKLRDGVIILKPEFVRALLTKVDAFVSEVTSDPSPAKRPVAASAVAGQPDRAVAAREPEAMMTPSATPVPFRPARSNPT